MGHQKVTSLDALPAEILAQVVNLVPSQQGRNACSLVCRAMRAAERATRTEIKLRCSWDDLQNIPCCFQSVRTLGLEVPLRSTNEDDDMVRESRLTGAIAKRLSEAFPSVAVISLPGDVKLYEPLILDLGHIWPDVRWVTGVQLAADAGCAALLKAFTELREVHFQRSQPSDFLPACKELSHYKWYSLEKLSCGIDASTFLEVVPKCTDLQRIDLQSTKEFRIDADKLSAVFENCHKLERMDLDAGTDERYKPLLTAGAFDILSSCPNMVSIKVTEQVSCGKPIEKSLIEALSQTERVIPLVRTLVLDCGSTKKCKEEGNQNVLGTRVMKFTSLTELSLTLCRTDQTMLQVVEGCPNLQKLSLVHSMDRSNFESLITSLGQAPKLTDLSLEHYYDKLTLKEILECIDCLRPKLQCLRLHCAQSNRGKGPLAPPMQGWPVLCKLSITCFIGTGDAAFGEDWFLDCPELSELTLGFQGCDDIDLDTDMQESVLDDESENHRKRPIPPDRMGSGFVKNVVPYIEIFELQGHTGWPDDEIGQVLEQLTNAPKLRELDIDDFCPCYLQNDTWLTSAAAENVSKFPVLQKVWVGSGDLEDINVNPSRKEAFQLLSKSRSLQEIGIVMSGRDYHRQLLAEFNRSRMRVMDGAL